MSADSKWDTTRSLREISNDCSGGIKTYIVKETEYFDPNTLYGDEKGPGWVYGYELAQAAYFKADNGYYDDVLVKYAPAGLTQLKETSVKTSDFFNKDFNPKKHYNDITEKEYVQQSGEFKKFVQSIKTFSPPVRAAAEFSMPAGENPDITLIRHYYYFLETGNLDAAYALMGSNAPKRSDFDSWYSNLTKSQAQDFKKTGGNTYQFMVNLQAENEDPELYRVTSTVSNGKIDPVSSEKISSPFVFSNNKYAFAKEEKGVRYLIVYDGKEETVVDQNKTGKPTEEIFFDGLRFSPKGDYLMYDRLGYEWFGAALYDIGSKKDIGLDASYSKADFTPDEKYFFTCGASEFDGTFVGEAYSVPDFKPQNILAGVKENYHLIDCNYDAKSNTIVFNMNSVWDDTIGNFNNGKRAIVTFDVQSGKIK